MATWLAGYGFGSAFYTLFLESIRVAFALAVADRLLVHSPVDGIKTKKRDLPAYTHRSFRRIFVTRAIEQGVNVKTIAEWQGHRDGGMLILGTYSHVAREHSARMALLMSKEA